MPGIELRCQHCDERFESQISTSLEFLKRRLAQSLADYINLGRERERDLVGKLVAHHLKTRNSDGLNGHKWYTASIGGELTGVIQVSGGGESVVVPGMVLEPVVTLDLDDAEQ